MNNDGESDMMFMPTAPASSVKPIGLFIFSNEVCCFMVVSCLAVEGSPPGFEVTLHEAFDMFSILSCASELFWDLVSSSAVCLLANWMKT